MFPQQKQIKKSKNKYYYKILIQNFTYLKLIFLYKIYQLPKQIKFQQSILKINH